MITYSLGTSPALRHFASAREGVDYPCGALMGCDFDRAYYDRHGFVVVRRFLDGADLAELQAQLARYIRDVVPTLADTAAFYQDRARPETLKQLHQMEADDFFRQYARHPHWTALAQTLVGEEVQPGKPEWFNKPPDTNHVTPPHQDNFYFCLEPANVVTLWLALDSIDAENGCLRYVSGSHRGGFRAACAFANSRILARHYRLFGR